MDYRVKMNVTSVTEFDLETNVTSTSEVTEDEWSFDEDSFETLHYLSYVLGPQRQPPEKLIPLTIIYSGN